MVDATMVSMETKQIKQLARVAELESPDYVQHVDALNQLARQSGLLKYVSYSRIWEYPWLWQKLQPLREQNLVVLDVGSEKSVLPWFLAQQGFHVIVSDMNHEYWNVWQQTARALNTQPRMRLCDAMHLDLPTASVDVYLSVSVIEHVQDKARALSEAARVLKPGGLLIWSFDICEPELGMTFPDWNGRALTMRELDELFRHSTWFEPGLADLPWNTNDIATYWAWNRATAPHHNYITGGLVVRRNAQVWRESWTTSFKYRVSAFANPTWRRWRFKLRTALPG